MYLNCGSCKWRSCKWSSEHKNLKEFSTRVAIFSSVILYVKISSSLPLWCIFRPRWRIWPTKIYFRSVKFWATQTINTCGIVKIALLSLFSVFRLFRPLQGNNNGNAVYILGYIYICFGPFSESFNPYLTSQNKVIPAQNIFIPMNLNSIVLLLLTNRSKGNMNSGKTY